MIILFFFGLCFFGIGDCDNSNQLTEEESMIIHPAGVQNPTLVELNLMQENFQKFKCEKNPDIYRQNRTLSIEELTSLYYQGKKDGTGFSIGLGHQLDYERCDNITDDMEQPTGKFVRFCIYVNDEIGDCSDWIEESTPYSYCRNFDGKWQTKNQEQMDVRYCIGMTYSDYIEKFKEIHSLELEQ